MTKWLWTLSDLLIYFGFGLAIGLVLLSIQAQVRSFHKIHLKSELSETPRGFFLASVAVAVLALVLLSFMLKMPFTLGLAAALACFFCTSKFLKNLARKRYVERFEDSLIDGLVAIASALRAGVALPNALAICASNSADELSSELSVVLKQYRLGVGLEEALDNLRKRVNSENANIAFGAMIISSQLGGNLPAMLSRVSSTIQERNKVSGKLRSLTAQGRMQALLVGAAPPALALMIYLWDQQKFALLTDTLPGQLLLGLAITLELLGVYAMRRSLRLVI